MTTDYDDLCKRLRLFHLPVSDGRKVIIAEAADAIEKLEGDNAALRQDAERYRILVETLPLSVLTIAVDVGYSYQVPHAILKTENREAILDAALLAGKEKP